MLVSDVQHTNLTLYKLQNSHHNKSLPSLTIHNCYIIDYISCTVHYIPIAYPFYFMTGRLYLLIPIICFICGCVILHSHKQWMRVAPSLSTWDCQYFYFSHSYRHIVVSFYGFNLRFPMHASVLDDFISWDQTQKIVIFRRVKEDWSLE